MARRWIKAAAGRVLARVMPAVLAVSLCLPASLSAQTILRDPDIEHALRELSRPMIIAAGLSPSRLQILVVHDDRLNAFVADADHVFIHSGLLLKVQTARALQAVIAHELAHIANGHLARRALNYRAARNTAAMGMLLSAIAASAGAGDAAQGILLGASGTAQRVFLGHTRAEEASADQSAVRYMTRQGVDAQGMIDVLSIFRGQEVLAASRQDPYMRTHPLSRDRMRAVQGYVAAAAGRTQDRPDDAYWFARARGKLEAFIRNPTSVLRRIDANDTSDIAMLKRAVALHRIPKPDQAVEAITALVQRKPKDPFLAELQGQILLESRRFTQAVAAYARAAQLAPNNALILAGYGRALLAMDTGTANRNALKTLQRAYARDPFQPAMLRDLGLAYARRSNPGMASLSIAERYALIGRLKDAATHATRAEGLLPRGSPGWNRAQDILHAAQAAEK